MPGDNARSWVDSNVRPDRRDVVYKNITDEKNKIAFDASNSAYGEEKSTKRLADRGYQKDESLSSKNTLVLHNPGTGHTVLAYRGTTEAEDLVPDAELAVGNFEGEHFQKAYAVHDKVKQKYKDVTVTGHSLGGSKAYKAAERDGSNAIIFNPGTGLKTVDLKNHVAFRGTLDPISARSKGSAIVDTPGGHSLKDMERFFYPTEPPPEKEPSNALKRKREADEAWSVKYKSLQGQDDPFSKHMRGLILGTRPNKRPI